MKHNPTRPIARLALSSGEVFHGTAFGILAHDDGSRTDFAGGEVVFNTAMSGYQESLTDPSYTGQILVQTTPMVGITGMNNIDLESTHIRVRGLIIHEHVEDPSNYRALESLDEALKRDKVAGIAGIDTRALTRILRDQGATVGILSADPATSDEALVELANGLPSMEGSDLASGIGASEITPWVAPREDWSVLSDAREPHNSRIPVGVIDCGTKGNIPELIAQAGADPVLIPMDTDTDQIKQLLIAGQIRGIMISNGPGDPATLTELVETIKSLLNDPELSRYPIYGICLGHQILALAQGATTYKLRFGHRGINHPVRNEQDGKIMITSQNHGFAVDADSINRDEMDISSIHLNDGTVAGLARRDRPVRSVQFHPEASPGPHDSAPFISDFVRDCAEISSAAANQL